MGRRLSASLLSSRGRRRKCPHAANKSWVGLTMAKESAKPAVKSLCRRQLSVNACVRVNNLQAWSKVQPEDTPICMVRVVSMILHGLCQKACSRPMYLYMWGDPSAAMSRLKAADRTRVRTLNWRMSGCIALMSERPGARAKEHGLIRPSASRMDVVDLISRLLDLQRAPKLKNTAPAFFIFYFRSWFSICYILLS